MQPLVILIEAKLWAEKSGVAQNDQHARYLQSSSDLGSFNPPLPISAKVALVYLTPRESLSEVMETLALCHDIEARGLLFRVQWQDVIDAAERSLSSERDSLHRLILTDVAGFLRRRGLEYFKGFSTDSRLPLLNEKEFAFYLAELERSRCLICQSLSILQEVNGRMTEYGEKIGAALKAVVQLNTDTSKLLVDFDKKMPGYSSVFGNGATSELTYHVRAECWIASGVYRYHAKPKSPDS